MGTPDDHAAGLTQGPVDALRYDDHPDDPFEVAGILRSMMPSHARVLDVGCGTGSVTAIANRDKGNEVFAIEPDPERAAAAQARGFTVHRGVLDEAFIGTNGPFDVVMSSDVLEHMPAPADALRLFAKALKPEGLLLVSVPNVAHWSVRGNLLLGRFEYEEIGIMDATHLRWFTQASIVRLFEECGFRVTNVRHTAGIDLGLYYRRGLGRIPRRLKKVILHGLLRVFPRVFGAQHVLAARPKPQAS